MFKLSLPTIAILAAAIAASYGGTYLKGRYDGSAATKAEWNAAIARNISDSNKIRNEVDKSVPLNPESRELCDDKWNRNPC